MRRTLNWNNRNRVLTTAEQNRGWTPPRDLTRKAPRLSNGRWVPVNTRAVSMEDR